MGSAYAEAYRQSEGVWEVFCGNCHKSIGTMTGDILQKAIIATADRGGVLCPDCRKKACNGCGIQWSEWNEFDDQGFCEFCVWEIETGKPKREADIFLEVTLV